MDKMKTLGMQFTEEQREWLQSEAERLDRSVPWIVRSLISNAMEQQRAEQPRARRVKPDRRRVA